MRNLAYTCRVLGTFFGCGILCERFSLCCPLLTVPYVHSYHCLGLPFTAPEPGPLLATRDFAHIQFTSSKWFSFYLFSQTVDAVIIITSSSISMGGRTWNFWSGSIWGWNRMPFLSFSPQTGVLNLGYT